MVRSCSFCGKGVFKYKEGIKRSNNPMKRFDWYEIMHLESIDNLKDAILKSTGREINTTKARNIGVCLQHGRQFFEVAQKSPYSIKPLLIFYGMVNFAKAVTLSRDHSRNLEALPGKHGLLDVSPKNSPLESLEVKVEKEGTFQDLNDVCSQLECLAIYGEDLTFERRIKVPTARSSDLSNKRIDLKDLLARIEPLNKLYRKTFGEEPKNIACSRISFDSMLSCYDIHLFTRREETAVNQVAEIVMGLRERFKMIENWAFETWTYGGDIKFCSQTAKPEVEFLEKNLVKGLNYFSSDLVRQEPRDFQPIETITQPMLGLFSGDSFLTEPLGSLYLSEMSLYYLAMFLLGSLVRYQPHIWADVLSHREVTQVPIKDRTLALLQYFMDLSVQNFPRMTLYAITVPDP